MGVRSAFSFIKPVENRAERKKREKATRELVAVVTEKHRKQEAPQKRRVRTWGAREAVNSLWGPPVARTQPNRASALTLAGAYPFIAEAGLGSRGVWIGKIAGSGAGADFVFDPWELYQQKIVTGTSIVLIGTVGTGKSSVAKSLITRSVLHGRKCAVASDPKGEWAPVAHALGGDVIALSATSRNRLNPLDEGPRDSRLDEDEWKRLVNSRRRNVVSSIVGTLLGRRLLPHEYTVIDVAVSAIVEQHQEPTLTHLYDAVREPLGEDAHRLRETGFEVADALRRLVRGDMQGIFDGPSTVKFNPDSPIVVMDTSGFIGQVQELMDVATLCAATWLEAAVMDPNGGKRYVVYDEGYRMLRNEQQLLRMSDQWKLARQYGLSNMLIMHRITDLDAIGDVGSSARALAQGLLSDSEIRIVYRQEADVLDRTRLALGLTREESAVIQDLPMGMGLWKIAKRPFVVANLLTPDELDAFNTSHRADADAIAS